ncbi:hypothetical protein [Qipengyuania sp. ASV99]|uniref:hypothetical protein n=1 Tax=Qipengyuania sp. ASV99 TaxID=3399681 RepID=UPI003A4C6F03
MKRFSILISASALLALAACSGAEDADATSETDDFAARINGANPAAPTGNQTPTVMPPRENAAEGAYSPGTATDPESATCGANVMGPYIGKVADDATRAAIVIAATGASDVRFILPGSEYIRPDPTNPRLNLMLDPQGIIRDARCG